MGVRWDDLGPELQKKLAEQNEELAGEVKPEKEPAAPNFPQKLRVYKTSYARRYAAQIRRMNKKTWRDIEAGRFTSGE